MKLSLAILFVLILGCVSPQVSKKPPSEPETKPEPIASRTPEESKSSLMDRVYARWTGDLEESREKRRFIRVLVSYNNTNFFVNLGETRGLESELLNRYEQYLNRESAQSSNIKTKIVFRAVPFQHLIQDLLEGRGDIVAAGLTITPEREKLVSFTLPYIKNINEIVVTSKSVKDLTSIKDLAGRKVYVLSGSSYVQHLHRLNDQLKKDRLKPIHIVEADNRLASEDILQMVNAGIYELTVVDSHIAEIWSKVLKNLTLRQDLVIRSGGNIAWAVRKGNPQLLASLNDFIKIHGQGKELGNLLIRRYYGQTKWIQDPTTKAEKQKFEALTAIFKKYAGMYGFDWHKIAALAYQESRFEQNTRSRAGAVGVMQIKPTTAADPKIGILDVEMNVENNIHAGVKYLAFLRDRYFKDPNIHPIDRVDFTFAAYNAGPARINSLRRSAKDLNLNPDKWFFNVEHVARRVIGQETVRYVSNINKYYIAYKSVEKASEERRLIKQKSN